MLPTFLYWLTVTAIVCTLTALWAGAATAMRTLAVATMLLAGALTAYAVWGRDSVPWFSGVWALFLVWAFRLAHRARPSLTSPTGRPRHVNGEGASPGR